MITDNEAEKYRQSLDKIIIKEKKSRRWMLILLVPLVALIAFVIYSAVQTVQTVQSNANQKIAASDSILKQVGIDTARKDTQQIQRIAAGKEFSDLLGKYDLSKNKEVRILYYQKDIDSNKVYTALSNLNFNLQLIKQRNKLPTNSLWYGQMIDSLQVKLVAYYLINSGIQLTSIEKMDVTKSPKTIAIGSTRYVQEKRQPISADSVKKMKLR